VPVTTHDLDRSDEYLGHKAALRKDITGFAHPWVARLSEAAADSGLGGPTSLLATLFRFVRAGAAVNPRWTEDWSADDGY
jgi:hypothetical protein